MKKRTTLSTYHGEENAEFRVHVNSVTISESEVLPTLLLAGVDDGDLLGSHGEDGQGDAVELVEATP